MSADSLMPCLSQPAAFQTRKRMHAVRVGNVQIGGDAPVLVQSMTNTDTANAASTIAQVKELADAGSEIVRITVNNEAAAAAVPEIRAALDAMGCYVPLVGDFHYNGHRLLNEYPEMAQALGKYRINPGNVGFGAKHDLQFSQMIETALRFGKPVRIGANWGSLDQAMLARMMDANAASGTVQPVEYVMREALVASALESAKRAEELGMPADRMVISCKVSRVSDLLIVYRMLAERSKYALHLGLTEAGMGIKGIVASTAALAPLLAEGIGDTIRVSLTPEPGASRTQEVRVAQEILQSLGLRAFVPQVTACPGCGRTTSTVFQELASSIDNFLRSGIPQWREKYVGVENLQVAVMGCIVNGPGESKHANIGISLPGTGETPAAPVFVDGQKVATLRGERIAEEFETMVLSYIESHYPKRELAA